jgi:hypothetical protein
MFATLCVPMTLSLAGSCNQDGLLIATACLAAALLTSTRLAASSSGAAALALVLAAKPLYLPLAVLVPLARPLRGWALGARAGWFVLTALPAVLWYLLAAKYAVVGFDRGAYAAGPLWPGPPGQAFATTDPAAQLRVFLHDPTLLFRLPIDTIAHSQWLFHELVGVIGTLDLFLPDWLYLPWFAALGAALAATLLGGWRSAPGWPMPHCLFGLAAVIATVFAVYDGQYLTWTPVGATLIEGPTGRYLLPILPFLGLVLPRLRLRGGDALRVALTAPAVLMAAAGLIVIPVLLVRAYYLG